METGNKVTYSKIKENPRTNLKILSVMFVADSFIFNGYGPDFQLLSSGKMPADQSITTLTELAKSYDRILILHTSPCIHLPQDSADKSLATQYLNPLSSDKLQVDRLLDSTVEAHYYIKPSLGETLKSEGLEWSDLHISSIMVHHLYPSPYGKALVLHIDSGICIAVVSENRLLYYNQFQTSSKEDSLYYISSVYDELKLDKSTVSLAIGGVDGKGDLYKLLAQYFSPIQLVRPNLIKSSNNELDLHYRTELALAYLCGL